MKTKANGLESAYRNYSVALGHLKDNIKNVMILDGVLALEKTILALVAEVENHFKEQRRRENEEAFDRVMQAKAAIYGAGDRVRSELLRESEDTQELFRSLSKKEG